MENIQFRVTNNLLASQGQRFLNYIIDYLVQIILIFIISYSFESICVLFGNDSLINTFEEDNKILDYLVGIIVALIYYTIIESFFSISVGKLITGTIVVLQNGEKPDSQIILKRTLCRLIPFDGLSFFGTPSRGWHDSMSNTFVVNKKKFESEKELFYSFKEIGSDIIEE